MLSFAALAGLGALAGGINQTTGILSAAQNYYYARKMADYQFKYNRALMNDAYNYNNQSMATQNNYNVQNAQMAQGWTQENMRLSSDLERQNWQYAFDAQNAYNDPSAQYQRLLAAGYNPQLANGTVNTLGGSGMSSSPNASAPSISSAGLASVGASSVGLGSVKVDLANDFVNGFNSMNSIAKTAMENELSSSQVKKNLEEAYESKCRQAALEIENSLDELPYIDNAGNYLPNPNGHAYLRNPDGSLDDSGQPYLSVKQAREMKLAQAQDEFVDSIVTDIVKKNYDIAELMQRIQQNDKMNPLLRQQMLGILENLKATKDQINSISSWYDEQTRDIQLTRSSRLAVMAADAADKNAQADFYKANKQQLDYYLKHGKYLQDIKQLENNNLLTNVQATQAKFYFNKAKAFINSDPGTAMYYFKMASDCIAPAIGSAASLGFSLK